MDVAFSFQNELGKTGSAHPYIGDPRETGLRTKVPSPLLHRNHIHHFVSAMTIHSMNTELAWIYLFQYECKQ